MAKELLTKQEEIERSNKELEQYGYKQELKRALPLPFLVFYGWAFVCLLTLFGTYGAVAEASHGMAPSAYLLATIGMLFTAWSYVVMSKRYPVSGSVYQYVGQSMNKHLGFLSGWAILLDYMLVPMINYLLAATYIRVYFDIPTWAIILFLLVVVSIVNHIGIEVTAWFNNAVVFIEIVFIVAITLMMIKYVGGGNGAGTLISVQPFLNTEELNLSGVGYSVIFAGAAITMANYSGFDAVTTMSEEAKNSKNISRAVWIILISISIYFVVVTYLMGLAWPEGWKEFANPDDAAWQLIVKVAGDGMGVFFVATYVVATTASGLSSQASAARVIYNMGRDGILPKKFFGYIHPKRKTPTGGIIVIGLVALTGLFVPLTTSFLLLSFGACLGFIMVNVSAIATFYVKEKKRGVGGFIKYALLPAIGAVICLINFLSISKIGHIVGVAWLLLGFIILAISTKGFKISPKDLQV